MRLRLATWALLVTAVVASSLGPAQAEGVLDGVYKGKLVDLGDFGTLISSEVEIEVKDDELYGLVAATAEFDISVLGEEATPVCFGVQIAFSDGNAVVRAGPPPAILFSGEALMRKTTKDGKCAGPFPTSNAKDHVVRVRGDFHFKGTEIVMKGTIVDDGNQLKFEATTPLLPDDKIDPSEVDSWDGTELEDAGETLCRVYQVRDEDVGGDCRTLLFPTTEENPIESARSLVEHLAGFSQGFGNPDLPTALDAALAPARHLLRFMNEAPTAERRIVAARAINNWFRAVLTLMDEQIPASS